MDDNAQAIRDAIRRLSGTFNRDNVRTILCVVDEVDVDARTCSVTSKNDTAEISIPDISLMVNINDGWLIIPKVGSEVYVTLTTRGLGWVSFFSQIEDVFLIASGKIQFNDGTYGGLVRVAELTEKLNAMVTLINAQLDLIASGIATAGGAYSPTHLDQYSKDDYENPDITHGPK